MTTPLPDAAASVTSRPVADADAPAISALHGRVFGPGRFVRSAYRVREGTPFASRYCRVALAGDQIVAALRMTPVRIGTAGGALLLGPLAVNPAFANLGHGRRLIAESLTLARADGLSLVVLVGDMAYYGRLGFLPVQPLGKIRLPGPADPARILALELRASAVGEFAGLVAPQA
ncbi:MAG: GNAT family N-acetyltransferase [Hyphomicrobiaceae bacterium]